MKQKKLTIEIILFFLKDILFIGEQRYIIGLEE